MKFGMVRVKVVDIFCYNSYPVPSEKKTLNFTTSIDSRHSIYNREQQVSFVGGKLYLARRRNLIGEQQMNLVTSGAERDELSPFSGTNPLYYSIYHVTQFFSLIFSRHFQMFIFIIKILRFFTKSSTSQNHVINCLRSRKLYVYYCHYSQLEYPKVAQYYWLTNFSFSYRDPKY